MVTHEYVEGHLKEEFENRLRKMNPPKYVTFEQSSDGKYIQAMIQFLYSIFSQGAVVGAEIAIEDMTLRQIASVLKEELKPRTDPHQ